MMLHRMAKKVKRSTKTGALASLQKQVRVLTSDIAEWKRKLETARKSKHVGVKEYLIDPGCSAPRGTCRACAEFSTASVGLVESVRERNHVAAQISLFSQGLSDRKAGNLAKAKKVKGDSSRRITMKAALEVFGARSERPRSLLIRGIMKKRNPACDERTIRRHLNHPESIAHLEQAGKKIL
jgi:hypothetical protein